MENEIKVGEYVRTKEGYIGKLVEYIPNALNYLKIDVGREIIHCDNSRDNFIYTRYGFQLKHSPNLIDLIECEDYVNGEKVEEIAEPSLANDYNRLIYCNECEGSYKLILFNKDIKEIVTKEMMKSISYKVKQEQN